MQPVDNGRWKEPDAAAGIGWLQYMAWVKHKDPRTLEAADWCMQFLQQREQNPYYDAAKQISIDVGPRPCDLYDACTDTFLRREVRDQATVVIPADSAMLLVLPPSGGKETRQGSKTLVDGIVIDYCRSAT
jgi:hypothetical protein